MLVLINPSRSAKGGSRCCHLTVTGWNYICMQCWDCWLLWEWLYTVEVRWEIPPRDISECVCVCRHVLHAVLWLQDCCQCLWFLVLHGYWLVYEPHPCASWLWLILSIDLWTLWGVNALWQKCFRDLHCVSISGYYHYMDWQWQEYWKNQFWKVR